MKIFALSALMLFDEINGHKPLSLKIRSIISASLVFFCAIFDYKQPEY